jgi:molybdate transport system permease protein
LLDTQAIFLSLQLALWTLVVLIPIGIGVGYWLAQTGPWKSWVEAALALPLVLPPTVLGYYFIVAFAGKSLFGEPLVFSFTGLLIASIMINLPFAIQPIQRAYEAIPSEIKEAAKVSGLSTWQRFRLIELPLAWRGILSGGAMTFAHTLGEFGVVLMVGGAIPGETKTASIAIYDKVQTFDAAGAGALSLVLLLISLVAIAISYGLLAQNRMGTHRA